MAVWIFFSAAPTAQNSPELKMHIRNVAQDTSVYYSVPWPNQNHYLITPINHANVSWFLKKKVILVFFVLGLSRRWTRTDCSLRSAIGQCSRCQKYGSDVVAFEKLGSWAGAKKPWNHARYSPPQASPSKSKNYANATWWRPINRNWIRGM